jgi:NAD(P)-dependent dehydrogenase (short-subunit alcohol dehydrogenase family)
VMSDIEAPRLDEAVEAVSRHGTEVLGVETDVADGDAVDALGETTFNRFGTAHVICNNAGVAGGMGDGSIDVNEWKWVIDVNLWGVVHGHRVFLPKLIEQGEGHIVNTASIAGHLGGHGAYMASKWAVVSITLGLYQQMATEQTGVGVSCLCPGWVNTDIAKSDRNRPEWAAPDALVELTDDQEARRQFITDALAGGMAPDEVAGLVHDAVLNDKFWIFTDMGMVGLLADKHASILENRNPTVLGPLG